MSELILGVFILGAIFIAIQVLMGHRPGAIEPEAKWMPGKVISFEEDGSYLGHPTGLVTVQLENGESIEERALVAESLVHDLVGADVACESHFYLGFLKTDAWASDPTQAALQIAKSLGGEVSDSDQFVSIAFARDGVACEIRLLDDGWLGFEVAIDGPSWLGEDAEVEFNDEPMEIDQPSIMMGGLQLTGFDYADNTDDRDAVWAHNFSTLSSIPAKRLEDFLQSIQASACLTREFMECEFELIVFHPDVVIGLFGEFFAITQSIAAQIVASEPAQNAISDSLW